MPTLACAEVPLSESRRERARRAARLADEALLVTRLRSLGIRRKVLVHENRTVLVSLGKSGELRIHRGYAYGSDRVLRAIKTFISPVSRRPDRRAAEQQIVDFPIHEYVRPGVPVRRRAISNLPGDQPIVKRLRQLHGELNWRHFHGALSEIPFRVSDRMRTRLGELTINARTQQPVEIGISRRHVQRDGWSEVGHTVLHEMIHQWQAESNLPVDHGRIFRRKALEVGIAPRADRLVPCRKVEGASDIGEQ